MKHLFFENTSVCIASVGRDSLLDVIRALEKNSNGCLDYFVCLHESIDDIFLRKLSSIKNVNVCFSSCRHQVVQRELAVSRITREYVLQLDDDVLLSRDSLDSLVNTYESLPPQSALGPVLIKANGDSFFKDLFCPEGFRRLRNIPVILQCLLLGINNYKDPSKLYGKISRSGNPIGVPSISSPQFFRKCIEVDFISGGCMLLESSLARQCGYYPYARGRAALEDLYHSAFLQDKGCKLFVDRSAFLVVDTFDCNTDLSSRLLYLENAWDAIGKQLHFNTVYSYNSFRYLVYFLLQVLMVLGVGAINWVKKLIK